VFPGRPGLISCRPRFARYDRNELFGGGALRFAPAVKQIMATVGYDPQTGADLTWEQVAA
jgi:hypothetical protein